MCSISYCQQQMNTFKYQNIVIDIQYEGRLVVKERERGGGGGKGENSSVTLGTIDNNNNRYLNVYMCNCM